MLNKLRRSPKYFWTFVSGIAIMCGAIVQSYVNQANATMQRFGSNVQTYVIKRDLPAGQVIAQKDIGVRATPRAYVPSSAITNSPVGKASLVDLERGEIVLSSRLAPTGLQGAAALLHSGHRALAVPTAIGTPDLHVGDNVDVLLTIAVSQDQPPTVTVANYARVLAVSDDSVTVEVLPQEAERISYGLANGTVSLVLTPKL